MRILVLDEEFPHPQNTGKRIRSFHLLRRLAARHELHYLAYGRAGSDGHRALTEADMHPRAVTPQMPPKSGPVFYLHLLANLFSSKPYIVTSHFSQLFRRELERAVHEIKPELIICEWTPYAQYVNNLNGIKTLVVAHNIESDIWRRYAEFESSLFKRWYINRQLPKVTAFERMAFDLADGITVVSPGDGEAAAKLSPNSDICVVENGVDLDYFAVAGPTSSHKIVFTGSMDWRPNQDAATHFVYDIFPLLQKSCPDVETVFVGRNPPEEIRSLAANPGITVTGTVDDVRPFLRQAAVCIVPLRIGGGSRLKILEAMAIGRPVVSTPVGAEGLTVENDKHLLLAAEPQLFAARVQQLFDHDDLRERLARSGRRLVEERYGWDTLAHRLDQFCNKLREK